MQNGSKTVKSQGKDLGQVEFPIYETIGEFTDAVGETEAIEIINGAVETAAKNEFRRLATGGSTVRMKDVKALLESVGEDKLEAVAQAIKDGDASALADILNA